MKPLYLNSQRRRLAEDKPGPVCVGRRPPREQSRFAWRRNVDTEKPASHQRARLVLHMSEAFLCSCHCTREQMHCTHTHTLAGVKRCQLHLWPPAVKGHRLTTQCLRQKRGFSGRVCCGELQTTFLEPQTETGLRCDFLETCTSPCAERCCGSVGSERRPRKTWSVFAPIQVSLKPRLTPLYA